MWRSVSTEVAGWREALSDRAVWAPLAARLALAVLCSVATAVGVRYLSAPVVVLGVVLAVLVGSLAWLRAR